MECARLIVGVILPYVAVLVFLGGMIWRIASWKKLASPPMTLFPAPVDDKANAINTAKEVLFFKSLFASDRLLWVLAWTFHAVLALIAMGHLRVVTKYVDEMLGKFGMSEDAILAMSGGAGGAAGIVILIALALLLLRRVALQRAREITGLADYLALLLLAAIIITGDMMRFGPEHFDLTLTHDYFYALVTFDFGGIRNIPGLLTNNVFLVHMCLALVLIMFIPFSKILHSGGIFFTHQLIRKQ
jgi:nitrate reductase gamma subunit